MKKNINELTLSGLDLQNDIGEDEKCFEYLLYKDKEKCKLITKLNISNNKLTSFNFDNFFYSLTELNISNNSLSLFSFASNKLIVLDLSHNKIEHFPESISLMTNLITLNLSYNTLSTVSDINIKQLTKIKNLNLSNNNINFNSVEDFVSFSNAITLNMKKIENLNIEDNIFTTTNNVFNNVYFIYFIHKVKSLKFLNSLSVEDEIGKSGRSEQKSQLALEKMNNYEKMNSGAIQMLYTLSKEIELMCNLNDYKVEVLYEIKNKFIKKYKDENDNDHNDIVLNQSEKVKEESEIKIIYRILNQLKEISEKTKLLNEFSIVLSVQFSSIKKGKFCDECFNLLSHILSNNEMYITFFDETFIKEYGKLFDVLSDIGSDMKPNPEKKYDKNIITHIHLVLKHMKIFLNLKFPKILKMVLQCTLKLFINGIIKAERIYNTLYEIETIQQKLKIDKNDIVLLNTLYNARVKTNVIKYSIVNIKKCIKISYDDIDEETKNKITKIFFVLFYDLLSQIVSNEILKFSQKLMRKYLKIVCNIVKICKKLLMISQSDINQIIINNKIELQSLINNLIIDYFISSKYLTLNDSNDKKSNRKQIFSINTLYIALFEYSTCYLLYNALNHDEIDNKTKSKQIDVINTLYHKIINGKELKRENFDPVIFTGMNFSLLLYLKHSTKLFITDYGSYISYFKENISKIILSSLKYLNSESDAYKYLSYNSVCYSNFSFDTNDENSFKPLCEQTNTVMLKYISSIVKIISFLGEEEERLTHEALDENEALYLTQIKNLNEKLNDNDRDNILIEILKIDNHKIKTLVIRCFTFVSPDQLSTNEIKELSSTMKTTNWVNQMECIFGETFFLLYKIFVYNFNFVKNCTLPYENFNLVDIALRILNKNNENNKFFFSYDRALLNSSIILFLMFFSANSKKSKTLFTKFNNDTYRNIILNTLIKETNFDPSIVGSEFLFPLDIEKLLSNWNIETIMSFISNKSIDCYNYISLRLLSHIADVLNNNPYKIISLNNKNYMNRETMNEISTQLREKEINRIKREKEDFQFPSLTVKEIELEGKANEYIYIKSKSFILNQQKCFIKNFNYVLGWIWGENKNISIKEIYQQIAKEDSRNAFKDIEHLNKVNFFQNWKEHSLTLNQDSLNTSDSTNDLYSLVQFISRITPLPTNTNTNTNFNSVSSYNDLYGETFPPIRKIEYESISNGKLRTLVISSFLRCLYSIFSPERENMPNGFDNFKIKNEFIQYLRNNDLLIRRVIILVSCSTEAQSASKGIQILLHILNKISIECNDIKMLINVENIIMISTVFILRNISLLQSEIAIYDKSTNNLMRDLCSLSTTLFKEVSAMSIIDAKTKELMIHKIISQELIDISLISLCQVMNKEYNTMISSNVNEEISYNFILREIMNLFLVYMSMGDENREYIMNWIFSSVNVKKEKIRKIFIFELIHMSKMRKGIENLSKKTHKLYGNNVFECFMIVNGDIEKRILIEDENSFLFANLNEETIQFNLSKSHLKKKDIVDVFIAQNRNCVFINIKKENAFYMIAVMFTNIIQSYDFINSLYIYSEKNNNSISFNRCKNFTKSSLISYNSNLLSKDSFFNSKIVLVEEQSDSVFNFSLFKSKNELNKFRYVYIDKDEDDNVDIKIYNIEIVELSKKDNLNKEFFIESDEFVSSYEIEDIINGEQVKGIQFKAVDIVEISYITKGITNSTKIKKYRLFDDFAYFTFKWNLLSIAKRNQLVIV